MSSDRPGSPEPGDETPPQPRRSRRAGRTAGTYDFRTRFGDVTSSQAAGSSPDDAASDAGNAPESSGTTPPPPRQRREGLREPAEREGYVRPRGRLTVRQLMEQMGVQEGSAGAAPDSPAPRQPQQPERRRPSRQVPPVPPAPPRAQSRRETAHPDQTPDRQAAERPQQPPRRTPPPPADVTQVIPPVPETPAVDLSDEATTSRLSAESRAQQPAPRPEPPRRPQQSQTPPPETPAAGTDDTPPQDAPVQDAPAQDTEAWTPLDAPSAATRAEPVEVAPSPEKTSDQPEKKSRRRPLQPTPDLTEAITKLRPRRTPSTDKKAHARKVATNSGRVLLALACLLSLVGTGYVWNLKRGWNGGWNVISALQSDDANVRKPQDQHGDQTYLIVGTDSRAGKNSKVGAGDSDSVEGSRADTIILVNIPADRSRVVAVSWPRDLAVDRPDCENWNNDKATYSGTLQGEDGVKLNSVYEQGGPACLVKTLTSMSGLNINHFIAMDFAGFEKVVRVLGGVEVCSTVPLYDYELGTILKRSGTTKLTGGRALNYVRARHVQNESNGDYGRIKRQQLFLSSLLRSTLSSDVLSNPAKLNRIVNTFIKYSYVDNVDTDSLIELAESMQGMDAGRVTFLTIPTDGTTTDGSNNEIPRTNDIDAIFNAIIDDKPLPGEKKPKKPSSEPKTSAPAAPKPQVELTAQNPSNLNLRVLNGSGKPGVASSAQEELVRQGLTVNGIADSSEKVTETVVRYGPGEKDSAATVAKMFPGARIQEDSTVKAGVEVVLGPDFQGASTIGAVPAAGSPLTVGELPARRDTELPNDLSVTNAGDTTCS